ADPLHNERWLQKLIEDDPSILGLGELDVRAVERRQRVGRLDLLLFDPASATRYEVEIQLGSTDESHIIRTIEYWDIERARYPQYEHCAVLVAEDITSRFLMKRYSDWHRPSRPQIGPPSTGQNHILLRHHLHLSP